MIGVGLVLVLYWHLATLILGLHSWDMAFDALHGDDWAALEGIPGSYT